LKDGLLRYIEQDIPLKLPVLLLIDWKCLWPPLV